MTKIQLIETIARAIAKQEGFYVTEQEAQQRRIAFPTLPQRQNNPGNLRKWSRNGVPFPRRNGYVVFPDVETGWSCLRSCVGQYIDGKYHNGEPPSLREFFHVFSPTADDNDPEGYAAGVAKAIWEATGRAVDVDTTLRSLIDGNQTS